MAREVAGLKKWAKLAISDPKKGGSSSLWVLLDGGSEGESSWSIEELAGTVADKVVELGWGNSGRKSRENSSIG